MAGVRENDYIIYEAGHLLFARMIEGMLDLQRPDGDDGSFQVTIRFYLRTIPGIAHNQLDTLFITELNS